VYFLFRILFVFFYRVERRFFFAVQVIGSHLGRSILINIITVSESKTKTKKTITSTDISRRWSWCFWGKYYVFEYFSSDQAIDPRFWLDEEN